MASYTWFVLLLISLVTVTMGVTLSKIHQDDRDRVRSKFHYPNPFATGQRGPTFTTFPNVPTKLAVQYAWTATATHYSPSQAGTRICPNYDNHCGAPSDGSQFWQGGICTCGGSDPKCSGGYCYQCNGANECQKECPSCPQTMCGRRFRLTCLDPYGKGYCRYNNAQVNMTVTNACPQYNPCNTCKGSANPCRNNYNHIDLCDPTFDAIAHADRQPAEGITIGVDPI